MKMYGPSLDGSGTVVNRDVPEADVQAYVAAGYKAGELPGAPTAEEYGASKPEPKVEETDLSKMTKAELLAEAEKQGVEVSESMTKAEITEAIEGK